MIHMKIMFPLLFLVHYFSFSIIVSFLLNHTLNYILLSSYLVLQTDPDGDPPLVVVPEACLLGVPGPAAAGALPGAGGEVAKGACL